MACVLVSFIFRASSVPLDTDAVTDCMNKSLTADTDREYWAYAETGAFRHHGCKCRMGVHDEPTWYFSFMGRKEDMMRFTGSHKRKRED